MNSRTLTVLTSIFLMVIFAYPKSINKKLMDYNTGLFSGENAVYEEAKFNERDSFLGFKHTIDSYDKHKFSKRVRRDIESLADSRRLIRNKTVHLLDSLKCINPLNDTVIVMWTVDIRYFHHELFVMSKSDSIHINTGYKLFEHESVYNYIERNPQKDILIEVISKWNETDISRLMSCSIDFIEKIWISAMRAIIKDNEVVSRKIYVFPLFAEWCMHHRYHPDNPFREDILYQDRRAEYKRILKEAQKINPDTVIDIDLDYLMGTKDEK